MGSFTDALIEVVMLKPLALVMMIALAAPAAAQGTVPQQSVPASKDKDPNRIICERQEEIGTRLGGKKVCKTAAQWDEERRLQREDVQKYQQQATGVPVSG